MLPDASNVLVSVVGTSGTRGGVGCDITGCGGVLPVDTADVAVGALVAVGLVALIVVVVLATAVVAVVDIPGSSVNALDLPSPG